MKSLITLLFTCIAHLVFAQPKILYYKDAPAGQVSLKVLKADLASDIGDWVKIMEESHVDLYHAISKERLSKKADELLAALPDSVERADAVFTVSTLASLLNEGHIGLASDPVVDSVYTWTAERFPYFLRGINETGAIVEYDLSKSETRLPGGSIIVSINGHLVKDLYQKYKAFFGGLPGWREVSVKDAFRKLLFMDNIKVPFAIVARNGSQTFRFSVAGYTRKDADSISRALASVIVQPVPFELKFLTGNIAMILFNDMDGGYREKFESFLDSSFNLIAVRKAKGLIIDLRKNGGGDSGLGELLISYFTGKSYRSVSGVKIRISHHGREVARLYGKEYSFDSTLDGTVYDYKVTELTKPADRPNRFTGKTAVLIGPNTFSSANMLANTISDYHLAKIFGEPTAEPGNDFGEVFSFMLPRTRIIARGATKMFVRANGNDKDFTGIQPDVFVKDQPGNKDRVVEAAVNWIMKK